MRWKRHDLVKSMKLYKDDILLLLIVLIYCLMMWQLGRMVGEVIRKALGL